MTLHYVFAFRFPVSLTTYRTARTHTLSHTHPSHLSRKEAPLRRATSFRAGLWKLSNFILPNSFDGSSHISTRLCPFAWYAWCMDTVAIRYQYSRPREHGRKTRGADWYSLPYSLHSYTYRIRVYAIGALSPHTLGAWFMMRNGQEAAYRITSKRVKG